MGGGGLGGGALGGAMGPVGFPMAGGRRPLRQHMRPVPGNRGMDMGGGFEMLPRKFLDSLLRYFIVC
jgi:hypothetical protein